jgi:hypothetical protein
MKPIERSAKVRQEADFVMEEIGLHDILAPCDRVVLQGSYYLNTMIYPDIDLYVSKMALHRFVGLSQTPPHSTRTCRRKLSKFR